jgi:hypothetical protein
MRTAFHTTTTVLPGHRVEVTSPDLKEGEQVQVVVIPTAAATSGDKAGPSIFDIVASLKGHRLFQTAEEVDRYINEERDSWER